MNGVPTDVPRLNNEIRSCRRCERAGYIPDARPVAFDGGRRQGIVLIGQAPGIFEHENGMPFGGRAGRVLFRWLASIDIGEAEFRDRVYMAAVTRCFPGKAASGSGDRKPSRAEIELCNPWLQAVLSTLEPRGLLLVGQLAIEQYLPGRRLGEIIGESFVTKGVRVVPLPHPSGASRWLNDASNKSLLKRALIHVRTLWDDLSDPVNPA